MSVEILCEICKLKMKNFLNPSHLKQHNISLKEYTKKYPSANIGMRKLKINVYVCKMCNKKIKGSGHLSKHLKKHHHILMSEYYKKFYLNDIYPICKCGCGENTKFKNMQVGYYKYIHNHTSPFIKNNILYKKRKSFISWNAGKTKESDSRVNKQSINLKKSTTQDVIEKRKISYKKTMNEKYGVDNIFQLNEIKIKSKKTLFKKYGVENPQFSDEIKYKWKNYILPSGKTVKCQGYEPFGFNLLLKENNENDIINDKKFIPKIKYIDGNKIRAHCPDFFIPKKNLLIDVKSNFTYNLHKKEMSLKQNAAISAGYDYKIYIFNGNGKINKII